MEHMGLLGCSVVFIYIQDYFCTKDVARVAPATQLSCASCATQ